jgi:beta-N-acetylhexosaminidase
VFQRFKVFVLLGFVAGAIPALAFTPEVRAVLEKADAARLERIGHHIITGMDSIDSVKLLVEKRAIAGIFITDHNVKGKTAAQVGEQIAKLQAIRASQGLPPLIVAADQEGGSVSRLSPPLKRQPTLASLIADPSLKKVKAKKVAGKKGIAPKRAVNAAAAAAFKRPPAPEPESKKQARVEDFARIQAAGLKAMGVNLNFSPVVDLKTKLKSRNDGETNLSGRAISDDAELVTKTATWYCNILIQEGVMCTLKHFPGLGRVAVDTHRRQATLNATRADLLVHDWAPYRALMEKPGITTMLGHVKLAAVDDKTPASFSTAVIDGLIRQEWHHGGLLVTDDFSMGAVTRADEGMAGAAIKSLNAGSDLVLVSWGERDLASILSGLLDADEKGKLDHSKLEASVARMTQARIDIAAKNN